MTVRKVYHFFYRSTDLSTVLWPKNFFNFWSIKLSAVESNKSTALYIAEVLASKSFLDFAFSDLPTSL